MHVNFVAWDVNVGNYRVAVKNSLGSVLELFAG
jgi:hypothetical protein